MDKKRKEIKQRLMNITTVAEFEDILNTILMSEEEQALLRLIYKEKKSIGYIADIMGMSESTVKAKNRKMLMKIGSYF